MMRFLPASLTTILVELADLEETLALFSSLVTDMITGIEETVPAARTLMIRFDPDIISAKNLAAALASRDLTARPEPSTTLVEIPVWYDGEDLHDVAALTGLTVSDVIRRHTESQFTVAFCGFAPGFGYLAGGDPALHVPRRQSPRTRIPAGSVALAGEFSGVYPQNSPGGWQIIGTTALKMWDIDRQPGALLQPGARVRFIAADRQDRDTGPPRSATQEPAAITAVERPHFRVLTAPLPATFQDLGRVGHTGQGVSASGALDRAAFHAANRLVGNTTNTACLEVVLGNFSFTSLARSVIGVAGAPCVVTIDTVGRSITKSTFEPIAIEPGDIVTLGPFPSGMRCYLAVRGGFAVAAVLGSLATDTLAVVGPAPVRTGSILTLADRKEGLSSVSTSEIAAFPYPKRTDVVTLDIVLGPRADWFTAAGIETLTSQLWQVTPQSNRIGIRLAGAIGVERKSTAELPSEGTATGAIQIPHDGQPVLFLADHPLTGGYPVIGAVADYHLDLAGQLPINTKIRFKALGPFAEIVPTEPLKVPGETR